MSHRNFFMMLTFAMVALNALPIFSAYCGDGESCALMIRGYNLVEFSSWGALPVFTVMIVVGILFSFQKKSAKNAELLLLLAANVVCYVESMKTAREWITSVSNSPVVCHFGMIAYPMGIVAIIFYALLFINKLKKF